MQLFADTTPADSYQHWRKRLNELKWPGEAAGILQHALLHRDPTKFDRFREVETKFLRIGPGFFDDLVDPDWSALRAMAKSVQRDLHKMHAFVRFRSLKRADGTELLYAFHEPDHLILKATGDFFVRRFGRFEFWIRTPRGSAHWNGKEIVYHSDPGWAPDSEAAGLVAESSDDPLPELWKTYYASIFNPARLKSRTMQKEMPKKFWKHLPEAELIPELVRSAPARAQQMIREAAAKESVERSAYDFLPENSSWKDLNRAAAKCRGCELCERATQTVFGEGSLEPDLVFVGEQPGNDEDLKGSPFVGPAGQLLRTELLRAGLASERLYLTNAVKHFHWAPQGKFRLHQTPKLRHVKACRPWIDAELKLLRPKVIVCLGATAAQSVFGFPVAVQKNRGVFRETTYARRTLLTVHPSYLLRLQDADERARELEHFRADLARAKSALRNDPDAPGGAN